MCEGRQASRATTGPPDANWRTAGGDIFTRARGPVFVVETEAGHGWDSSAHRIRLTRSPPTS
jgi:hypothetical protein